MTNHLLALIAAGAIACSGPANGTTTIRQPSPEQAAESRTLMKQGDEQFARRGDRAALEAAISSWQQALDADPTDWQIAVKLARATQLMGELHQKGAPADQRAAWFDRGIEAAERGLAAQSPRFAQLRSSGVDIDDAIEALEPAAAPLVYWYATNLGSKANALGRVEGMKQKDRLVALMQWVLQRAPDYHFHGADRFFGAYYAAVPAFLGGDLENSRRHFEAAIAGAPRFSGSYLLQAEFYARAAGDRALWERLISALETMEPCRPDGPVPCVIEGWETEGEADRARARAERAKGF